MHLDAVMEGTLHKWGTSALEANDEELYVLYFSAFYYTKKS